ncbi:MAG: hypothetical protein IJR45_02365 [Firmicutes bacterium]|nr:hypothetical protein [Bacillota bacterium]
MNDINEMLEKLHNAAANDKELKKKLLLTQQADEPMAEFCRIAGEYGFPIDLGDLLVLNETLWGNMLKSTNGGATYPIEDWADAYEMFICGL